MSDDRWARLRPIVDELRREAGGTPALVAGADQLRTYLVGQAATFDVDLTDSASLYAVLVALALVRECARNGASAGIVTPDEDEAVRALCRAISLALADLAPAEARR